MKNERIYGLYTAYYKVYLLSFLQEKYESWSPLTRFLSFRCNSDSAYHEFPNCPRRTITSKIRLRRTLMNCSRQPKMRNDPHPECKELFSFIIPKCFLNFGISPHFSFQFWLVFLLREVCPIRYDLTNWVKQKIWEDDDLKTVKSYAGSFARFYQVVQKIISFLPTGDLIVFLLPTLQLSCIISYGLRSHIPKFVCEKFQLILRNSFWLVSFWICRTISCLTTEMVTICFKPEAN